MQTSLASQNPDSLRLSCAIAASIAAHALLLLAGPGHLTYGFGGDKKSAGDSPLGTLMVRLTTPEMSGRESAADIPAPVETVTLALADANTDAPEKQAAATPPRADAGRPDNPPAIEVMRGEPGVTASPFVPDNDIKTGLPFLQPHRYYTPAELDVRPQVKTNPVFRIPDKAIASRLAGKVAVDVLIDENGRVEDVAIVRAEPAGVFEESVIAGWRAVQFTPGMKTNAAVKSRVTLEISFDTTIPNLASQAKRTHY